MKIIIDSGHGGSDPGAIAFGTQEKDLNLIFAQKLAEKLTSKNYEVDTSLISDENYGSGTLTSLIRASQATLCISCHNNAANGNARGLEVIYSIHTKDELANSIINNVKKIGYITRNAYSRTSYFNPNTDYYFIIRETYPDVETIIIEFGFMDNSEDFALLTSEYWQNALANAVVEAICSYLPLPDTPKPPNSNYKEPAKETPEIPAKPSEHWGKSCNDELMEAGILFNDHSSTLDQPATEAMVICIANRLRKEFLKNE